MPPARRRHRVLDLLLPLLRRLLRRSQTPACARSTRWPFAATPPLAHSRHRPPSPRERALIPRRAPHVPSAATPGPFPALRGSRRDCGCDSASTSRRTGAPERTVPLWRAPPARLLRCALLGRRAPLRREPSEHLRAPDHAHDAAWASAFHPRRSAASASASRLPARRRLHARASSAAAAATTPSARYLLPALPATSCAASQRLDLLAVSPARA